MGGRGGSRSQAGARMCTNDAGASRLPPAHDSQGEWCEARRKEGERECGRQREKEGKTIVGEGAGSGISTQHPGGGKAGSPGFLPDGGGPQSWISVGGRAAPTGSRPRQGGSASLAHADCVYNLQGFMPSVYRLKRFF